MTSGRDVGRAPRVDRRRAPRDEAVAPHREQDPRADHQDRVEQRQERDDREDRDELLPAVAGEDRRRVRARQRGLRELRKGQHGQEREVDQQVDDDDRDDAADHRARQVARGIAVLLGEVERALPAAVGDHDRLQGEDDARKREAGRAARQPGASGAFMGTHRERGDDEREKRQELHRGRPLLEPRADLQARPLERHHREERDDRDRPHPARERRQEHAD